MAETKTERKKITIETIAKPRGVGDKGAQVTEFRGSDSVVYECWSSELLEHIKQGNEIEADVAYSSIEGKDGQTYFHNKITQIYIDGQPVKAKQSFGGRRYQDSPETRASIEAQKRTDIIAQLWMAGKIKDDDPLVAQMKEWLGNKPVEPQRQVAKLKQKVEAPVEEVKVKPKVEPIAELVKESPPVAIGDTPEIRGEEPTGGLDIAWVKKSCIKLKWGDVTIKSYLGTKFQVSKEGTLEEIIARLSQEQKEEFVREIQARLELL